ncbi:MAG: MFS transporter [Planctomycetota bacterium]
MNWTERWLPASKEERNLFLLAASWFFCLLSSYYTLKPIREAMGVELGVSQLQALFIATLLAMLVALPIYNLLVARLSRRWLVFSIYQFFVVCLALFIAAYQGLDQAGRLVVARVYFVWVSVFAMWSVSLFWSVAADVFSSESAKRLFGLIAAAGTTGAIASSLLASQLSGRVGGVGLWIAAGLLLQLGVLLGLKLESKATALDPARTFRTRAEQGSVSNRSWSGVLEEVVWPIVRDLFRSAYLLGTTAYICLIALAGTTVYSLLNQQVGLAITEPTERVAFFAGCNLAVQLLTLVLQSLLSARLLSRWGVGRTLMLLPLTYGLIFALLGWQLNLALVAAAFIAASTLAYGLTVPARELLFTVVDKSAKYRTKAMIDTVLFRCFDWLASVGVEMAIKQQWLVGYLVALAAIATGWCGLGRWLGQKQQQRAALLGRENPANGSSGESATAVDSR